LFYFFMFPKPLSKLILVLEQLQQFSKRLSKSII
jgi:hypothetical protein